MRFYCCKLMDTGQLATGQENTIIDGPKLESCIAKYGYPLAMVSVVA